MEHIVESTHRRTPFIIVSFVAVLVGLAVLLSSALYILLLIGGALLLFLILEKPGRSIYICVLLMFVPICMGKFLGNPVSISYFIVPTVTGLYLLQKFAKRTSYSLQWRLNPLLIPVLIYFSVVFANYLRSPVVPSDLTKLRYAPQGFAAWFSYLLSFCYYFMFAEVVSTDTKTTRRAIRFVWQLCLILTLLGAILIYSHSAQSILYNLQNQGIFRKSFFAPGEGFLSNAGYRLSTGGYRIDNLGEAASILLLLLLAGTCKVRNTLKWILYGFLGYSLVLSGGRSVFAGAVLALLIWMMIQKKSGYRIASFVVFLSLCCGVFLFYEVLPGSFQRILKIHGSFEQLDVGRATVFPLYWESFLHHPLFGVGIGSSGFRYSSGLSFLVSEQLRLGGHGAYISISYLMGLAGLAPFIWGLVGSLKYSYSLSKKEDDKFNASLAMFCFLWLVYYLISMGFGGRGSNMVYFAILGIVSGLCIKRGRGRHLSKVDE